MFQHSTTLGVALIFLLMAVLSFFWIPGVALVLLVAAGVVGALALPAYLDRRPGPRPRVSLLTIAGCLLVIASMAVVLVIDPILGGVMFLSGCAAAILGAVLEVAPLQVRPSGADQVSLRAGLIVAASWFGISLASLGIVTVVIVPILGVIFLLIGGGAVTIAIVLQRSGQTTTTG
jgi:hypothetical protein